MPTPMMESRVTRACSFSSDHPSVPSGRKGILRNLQLARLASQDYLCLHGGPVLVQVCIQETPVKARQGC